VKCGAADKTVYVVNATGVDTVLLDFATAPAGIELYDVFGRLCATTSAVKGVSCVSVPASGYLKAICR
jgi:hypothetical protein